MKENMMIGAIQSLGPKRQCRIETTVPSLSMRFILIVLAVCLSIGISNIEAVEGEDMGRSFAQVGSGYVAHFAGNTLGNWMLDRSDDFPTSSLSSLSVIVTSLAVSIGSSAAVSGAGKALDDDSRSLGWTLLGGMSAVGSSSLSGALIGLDDWKSGAAVGSVMGRYIAPISALVFYHLQDDDKKAKPAGKKAKFIIPLISVQF